MSILVYLLNSIWLAIFYYLAVLRWHYLLDQFLRRKGHLNCVIDLLSSKNLICQRILHVDYRAESRFAPSQRKTVLLCSDVSHWLGANLESTLGLKTKSSPTVEQKHVTFKYPLMRWFDRRNVHQYVQTYQQEYVKQANSSDTCTL